ncbi:MAG: efflux RND transporter periplasmic adaptor subunit [Planctomycetota bacterium]
MKRKGLPRGAGLLAMAVLFTLSCSRAGDEGPAVPGTSADRAQDSAPASGGLTLDPAGQEKIGLAAKILPAGTFQPSKRAFGKFLADPERTFLLRAPLAGIVHPGSNGGWPAIGQTLADGAVVGSLEPRLQAKDRIDLRARLETRKGDIASGRANLAAATAEFQRARKLNAEDKNVSDRALQEAQARVAAEQARLDAARKEAQLIEGVLASAKSSAAPVPLGVVRGGEVVEVLVQPGENVVAGTALLRLTRFDSLLARVELPIGLTVPPQLRTARLVPFSFPARDLVGTLAARLPVVEPRNQGQGLLFRVEPGDLPLRPGEALTAFLPLPGPPRKGVVLPSTAVLRFARKTWIYLRTGRQTFARQEVSLGFQTAGGWFTSPAWKPETPVVSRGAQDLLSLEMLQSLRGASLGED